MKKTGLDIIDPIHSFIRLRGPEPQIIDSPVFQRLRRIRQLSGAHLTYPGAQHTRFEHSLGVLHIAGLAGNALREKGIIRKDDVGLLRAAGLLHDIGHGPFSHVFEEAARNNSRTSHEDMGKTIIGKTEIGDILSGSGLDKNSVVKMAFGESKNRFMSEIVSGALSADMMDYLLRDGYYTGAEHAKIDHIRIIQSFGVHGKRLALEKSALYSFESMMHSRYQMFKAVYFHKSVRSAEVMLLEAIRLAYREIGLDSLALDDYVRLTDDVLMSDLLSMASGDPKLRRARGLAQDYQDRNLLKCVYEQVFTTKSDVSKRRLSAVRAQISKKSGVPEDDILADSSTTPSIPLAPSKKESRSIILASSENGRSRAQEILISEIPLVSALSGFMNILRIYTSERNRKKVEIAAGSILGGRGR